MTDAKIPRELYLKWQGRPYYSLDAYCKNTFHRKCYKVALNAHMTCPNRDGALDTRGCIFCSAGGSGDFAADASEDIAGQLIKGYSLIAGKLPRFSGSFPAGESPSAPGQDDVSKAAPCLIAYFQAYTNTYAPVSRLEQIFSEALDAPFVCGISIATRPDCLPPEVLRLLAALKTRYPGKFIWVELGLQTIHADTAAYIRRGYALSCFCQAAALLRSIDIPFIVHVILGLPGENPARTLETIEYLNQIAPFGVKLQLLHVLKGTDLASAYENGEFSVLSQSEYLSLLIACLERLSPDIVIHRLTGDGPKKILIAPGWSGNKRAVLNALHRTMSEKNAWQGRLLSPQD